MKRLIIKVSVALLTFCLGIITTLLYIAHNNQPAIAPQAEQVEKPSFTACYPGLSVVMNSITFGSPSYFPQGIFSENEWQNQFRVNWYSKHLKAMGETSFLSNVEDESYRFLWLRSFHRPIAVRIWRNGDTFSMAVKQLNGAGGYEPGKLIINRTRQLTKSEWNNFMNLLESSCYWQMPVSEERGMTDGAQWILEGVRDNRYHIVDRQSPETGAYREACLYLLKASGISIPGEDIY